MRSACLLVVLALVAGCRSSPPPPPIPHTVVRSVDVDPVVAIPVVTPGDPALVLLGEKLFSEKRLSEDGTVSCASCHKLDHGGADDVPRSTGVHGRHPVLNTPSIFNLGFVSTFGWYGTVHDLDQQIVREISADDRMGNRDSDAAARRLDPDPVLHGEFRARNGLGPDGKALVQALGAYIRSLASPGSPYDRAEKRCLDPQSDVDLGCIEFKSFGCASCHQGIAAGGNLTTKMTLQDERAFLISGVKDRDDDPMRFLETHVDDDRHVLRVPSLRNVACTAPYFHDGSEPSLEAAINREAIRQVGHGLNPQQVTSIATFLRSLTGTYQGKPL